MLLLLLFMSSVLSQRDGRRRPNPENQLRRRSQRYQRNRTRCISPEEMDLEAIPELMKPIVSSLLGRIPKVCFDIDFSFCSDDPELELNITVDDRPVLNTKLSDETQWCQSGNNLDPDNNCKTCIGIKKNSLEIKPNYAYLCPEYRLICTIAGIELKPEVGNQFDCIEFGDNCTAVTEKNCLAQQSCGWCRGHGRGPEYEDDQSPQGTGCTPMMPIRPTNEKERRMPNFRPFCAGCPLKNFVWAKPSESVAEKTEKYVESHSTSIIVLTISASIFVLIAAGCCASRIRAKSRRRMEVQHYKDALDTDQKEDHTELQDIDN